MSTKSGQHPAVGFAAVAAEPQAVRRLTIMISHDEVRSALAQQPMTAVFIDRHGNFAKLLAVPEQPTPALVLELSHSNPDFALVLRPRGNYSDADLEKWGQDTIEGFEVFEGGKLPPGWRHL